MPVKDAPFLEERTAAVMESVFNDPIVKKALEQAVPQEIFTIEEQIEICEVPAPPMKEQTRAAMIAEKINSYGLEASIDPVGNVIACRKGTDPDGPVCVISAHMDNSFREGTDTTVRRQNGRLFAPGISDASRALACMLQVIRMVVNNDIKTKGTLLFIATVGQEAEGDLRGVKRIFYSSGIHVDGVLVLDGADPGRLLYGSVGSKRYKIEYSGPGVKIQTPAGQEEYFSKGGVAIATGGFSANPEMVDKYIGGWATRMVLRGSKSTTGENISLTLPLYAKCVNMDQFHAGPIIGATHVNPADVLNSGYGIQVNTSGDRYMDENNTYVIKARTTAQKTLDNTGWVIVDSTCPVLDKVIPKFDMLNSPYGKANTIEEVAKQAGLPPAKIVALVKEYNDAVKNGTLGKMNPPNTYKKPHLIEKAPFYAVPLQGGMTATFGGPLINTKAEVQNLDGKTIPGLYAVGNSSGGIFFHNYAGGAQLGAATVFGRIAGKEMAQRAAAAK